MGPWIPLAEFLFVLGRGQDTLPHGVDHLLQHSRVRREHSDES